MYGHAARQQQQKIHSREILLKILDWTHFERG
jgi:hypothetical protein